ncbi:E3 ubiquitin-protein ligase RNF [Acrasis kona]|uniref:E3 ubiquitin-protein ligase RNF n=1 Tax=Acrasis kona TaxID=1008807 RepID=A0AAW2ZCZ7_9EUKA
MNNIDSNIIRTTEESCIEVLETQLLDIIQDVTDDGTRIIEEKQYKANKRRICEDDEGPLKKKPKLESPEVEADPIITIKTFGSFLDCPICHELFLKPHSLKCSHTFCSHCINKWLRQKKACPVCRGVVLRKPYYNRLIDDFLQQVDSRLSDCEKAHRNNVKEEVVQAQARSIQEFKDAANKALETGTKFLNINSQWNAREKEVFRIGYDKYDREDRIVYCGLTGFTQESVEQADSNTITTMLNNLGVEVPRYISTQPVRYDYEMARNILLDILLG